MLQGRLSVVGLVSLAAAEAASAAAAICEPHVSAIAWPPSRACKVTLCCFRERPAAQWPTSLGLSPNQG